MIRMLDKLFLFMYSLIIGILSVVLFFVGLNLFPKKEFLKVVMQIDGTLDPLQLVIMSTGIVLFLLSVRFFLVAIKRSSKGPTTVEQRSDIGNIAISLDTIESLALKAAAKQRGLKDLRARISVTDVGIEIAIRTFVDGDRSIPTLSQEIQRSVKAHVEEITGIAVDSVSVFVANITATSLTKSRVD